MSKKTKLRKKSKIKRLDRLSQIKEFFMKDLDNVQLSLDDLKLLYKDWNEELVFFDGPKIMNHLKTRYPHFTHRVEFRTTEAQAYCITKYNRPVHMLELERCDSWHENMKNLPKGTYARLDQFNPYECVQACIRQSENKQQIGSFIVGIDNPQQRDNDLLVVIGTATGFLNQLESITEPHDRMAVNGSGNIVDAKFWYSIHGYMLKLWHEKAQSSKIMVCEYRIPGVDSGYAFYNQELTQLNQFHYSGNMAMLTGLVMGYHRIMMVGCPIASVPVDNHLTDFETDTWEDAPFITPAQAHWKKGLEIWPEIKERVRSISGGLTEETLGREW